MAGAARELTGEDAAAILELDAAMAQDYPGGVATSHMPLTVASAVLTGRRRAFGVFGYRDELLAMTFADLDGATAEIDFTVVAAPWRGLGVGTGLKAASLLALIEDGIESVRTGGSADNHAIIRANTTIGFVIDQEWVTLTAPAHG
ncbi:MAG TPA: acetyltransferase [Intrasporangium sp.]|uniref:acetyltransferase n=1 Tax=Intrasporangium sp. TaxID=1925024 RepID=UPI002D79F522|nr:acetyltransferase [Intrasporangium sp.]HET7397427.1 acetyltransferase [Intrasporangium sp.]